MIIGCIIFFSALILISVFAEETKTGKKIIESTFKIIDSIFNKIVE